MLLGARSQDKRRCHRLQCWLSVKQKVGMSVEAGEPLVTVYSNREDVEDVNQMILDNIEIGDAIEEPMLVRGIITE